MGEQSPFTGDQQRTLLELAETLHEATSFVFDELNALILVLAGKGLITNEELDAAKAEISARWHVEQAVHPEVSPRMQTIRELLRRLREGE